MVTWNFCSRACRGFSTLQRFATCWSNVKHRLEWTSDYRWKMVSWFPWFCQGVSSKESRNQMVGWDAFRAPFCSWSWHRREEVGVDSGAYELEISCRRLIVHHTKRCVFCDNFVDLDQYDKLWTYIILFSRLKVYHSLSYLTESINLISHTF